MPPIKRSKKTTYRQYETMFDFLEKHPEMINGKITNNFTARRREELWTELAIILNSGHFGPQKTPKKWRRTWIDVKSETKQRAKEAMEQGHLKACCPPSPVHLERITSLLGLANVLYSKSVEENNCTDESFIKIKECFTEEMMPDTDVLNNNVSELDNKTCPVIKIEDVSNVSVPENTCYENGCDISSVSADRFHEEVPSILGRSLETPSEEVLNISISTESPHKELSGNLSTFADVFSEKVSDIFSRNEKTLSENAFKILKTSSDTSPKKHFNNHSKSKKTTCEKVCDVLTTSMKKLNDVVRNSENRTITVLNALTEATVRANELREKQLQIEKERNRLYQERTEVFSTLINVFLEKKMNHQY